MRVHKVWGWAKGNLNAVIVGGVLLVGIIIGISTQVHAATSLFTKESRAADTGSTTSVKENGLVNHVIRYNNNDSGVTSNLALDDTLTNQTLVGAPQAITGWDLTNQTSSSFQFKGALIPPGGKGLVFNTSQLAGTISGASGGGDGFVPLFADNGNIYWVFHHISGTVQCANPATGTICPGYPKALNYNIGGVTKRLWSGSTNHQHTIVGNKLYSAGGLLNVAGSPNYQYGIGCFDLATGVECAYNPFQVLGTFPAGLYHSSYSVVSTTEQLIGNNMYIWDHNQNIWCYDIVNQPMTACPGYPIDMSGANYPVLTATHQQSVLQEGTRLFNFVPFSTTDNTVGVTGVRVKCFDVTTQDECVGWGTDGKLIGAGNNAGVYAGAFIRYDTSLNPTGVCSIGYVATENLGYGCVAWSDGVQVAEPGTNRGIPQALYNRVHWTGNAGSVGNPGHRPGDHRTYFTGYGGNMEYCWDWVTNDACKVATQNATNDFNYLDTAPGDGYFGDNGYLRHPAGSGSRDYGARYQASSGCWWSQGDANLLWSFDDDGNVPCIPNSVRDKTTLNISSAYCSSGLPGDAAWTVSKVTNFNTANWTKFVVEIKDPAGNVLLSYDAKTSTTANISSIDAQLHPEISYFIYAAVAPGQTPFSSAATTPLVSVEFSSASPIEFCAQTRAAAFVCNGSGNTVANLAELRIGAATTPVASSTTSLAINSDPAGKCADMSLTQQAVDPASGTPITSYTPGTNVDWVMEATNVADYMAENIIVHTTFPSGVTPTFASGNGWDCVIAGQDVTCTRPSQAPGMAPPLTIQTHIASSVTGPIVNTATVSSDADDPTPANNSAAAEMTADPQSDLTIAKRHDQTPVAGSIFTYSFDVTNNGPSDTPSFAITDTLHSSLTFVASGSSPECSAVGQVVTCSGGALASGASTTLHFVVTVGPSHTSGAIANSATVSGPFVDPQPGNNTSVDNIDPSAIADVAITKHLEGELTAGEDAVYTISVRNNGPSSAENVTITDNLPVGLTFVAVTSLDWQCVQTGSVVSCLVGSILHPGDESIGQITVHVDSAVDAAIENGVSATSTATDPTPGNNFSVAAAEIEQEADLSVTKEMLTDEPHAGTNTTYRIGVASTGPSDASNVVIIDTLPVGLTYAGYTGVNWNCATSGQTVTCALTQLAANMSEFVDIDVAIASDMNGQVDNSAIVQSDMTDPVPTNNSVIASATVIPATSASETPGSSSPTVDTTNNPQTKLAETGQSMAQWAVLALAVMVSGGLLTAGTRNLIKAR